MSTQSLRVGEQVFHPAYGFGVLEGRTTRDEAGQYKDYYGVRLSEGGVLSVPVARAESLGLRRLVVSLKTILECLHSSARPLPDNDRQRVVELKARWHAPEPMALPEAVRDLLARGRTRNLTPADKKWLISACERLSDEAARVDGTDQSLVRAALQREVDQVKLRLNAR